VQDLGVRGQIAGFRVQGSGVKVQGFRVQGAEFRVLSAGFRVLGYPPDEKVAGGGGPGGGRAVCPQCLVEGLGFMLQGAEFRVQGSEFRIQGSEFRVQGCGFRVQGYLAHRGSSLIQGHLARMKKPPPSTLQQDYALALRWSCGGGAVSYEQGTPAWFRVEGLGFKAQGLGSRAPPGRHQPSERDQIDFSRSWVCTDGRRSPATHGAYQGN